MKDSKLINDKESKRERSWIASFLIMKPIMMLVVLLMAIVVKADLVDGLIKVESNGNNRAVGDKGKAIGCLQVWKVVVDDVNRVYKTDYKHEDMFDRAKSVDVCKKYLLHYGKVYKKQTGKPITAEVLARIWNSGPNGWQKPCSVPYWNKVKKTLKS